MGKATSCYLQHRCQFSSRGLTVRTILQTSSTPRARISLQSPFQSSQPPAHPEQSSSPSPPLPSHGPSSAPGRRGAAPGGRRSHRAARAGRGIAPRSGRCLQQRRDTAALQPQGCHQPLAPPARCRWPPGTSGAWPPRCPQGHCSTRQPQGHWAAASPRWSCTDLQGEAQGTALNLHWLSAL